MMRVFSTYLLGFFVIYAEGSTTINVPTAGNCGDDTVLTCQVTGNIGSTGWIGLGRSLVINSKPIRPEDNNKYTETRGTSSFTLTIHNTDLTDEGEYRCRNDFSESQSKRLNIEYSDDGDVPMAECDNQECEEGTWFHLECVGLEEDNIPDEWFCSDKCRKTATQYCFCKKNVKEEAMVECCNPKCKNGSWFHAVCVGLTIDKLPKEDSIRAVATNTTELTLERHGKLVGGVGKVLDEVFTGMSEAESIKPVFFTTLLKNENFTRGKASAADSELSVTNGKKVSITVDKLYPSSPVFSASFRKENTDVTIRGSRTCSSSTQYSGYYRCIWSSSSSLADGSYTYSIVVTTITEADPLTGSFKIVSPNPPVISNTTHLDDSRVILYGNEGQSLTIQCTSTGGYPNPTVAWYKDSVSASNQLASTSSGTLQNDVTYIVTLSHTFTPTVTDDKKTLICRSYYPHADSAYRESATTAVMIYLRLKPSQPTVIQVSDVSSGGTVEVRCTTTGSRPAATITWSYQGSTFTGQDSSKTDNATETYTIDSIFRRQVTAADNGRELQCVVIHQTLTSPSERTASVKLNVQFSVQASTTVITGNKAMTATGTATLTLMCTTGSSNPASDITWKNGSAQLNSDRKYTNSTGENNGVVRSQQLVLKPTRYMDGDVVTCSVSNLLSQSPVTDKTTLDLRYSPLINIHGMQQTILTEGGSKILSCKVDSKPLATITWYHNNTQLSQDNPSNNVLNYSLSRVKRLHYGTYQCRANNDIGLEEVKQISVTIKFKPLRTSITGDNNIIANGQNKLSLDCTSGSSNPISDITWEVNGHITSSSSNLSDLRGEYGGMKRRRRLILTPTRANDGDVVTCEASNTLGTSEKGKATISLKYRPLIEPMHDRVAVEGNKTVLACSASSKPASIFTWYREGHLDVIYQGNGTLNSNQLAYEIDRVSRNDAGTYKCIANNGIETADEKHVSLIVHYPPVVSIVTQNTSVKVTSVSLECSASGVPNTEYVYGSWIQTWPGRSGTLKEYPGSRNLELRNLTYEHSGVYTCSASNGIKVFGTDKEYMEGSVQLVVESYPIITEVLEQMSAKLNGNVSIQIDIYSNTAELSVKIFKNVNGSKENVSFTESEVPIQVDLRVFTSKIQTVGTRASISMKIASKDDFGSYDVVVSNKINSTFRTVNIIPKGPPGVPSNLSVDEIKYKAVRLSWLRGYHGGFAQTFVVQVSTDLKKWRNVSSIFDGKNENAKPVSTTLTNLQDSTTYFLRVYAYNDEGKSSYTDYVNFSTIAGVYVEEKSASALAGAVGGTFAGLIIIALVIILVVMYRRKSCTKENLQDVTRKMIRKKTSTDENKIEMSSQDNPVGVYEQLQRSEERGNRSLYDSLEEKNVYENLQNEAYATKQKAPPRDVNHAIYENLKLNV